MSDNKIDFQSVPNQKAFIVYKKREAKSKTDVRIADVFKQDILAASRDLKDTTFKLYMYFISNQDGFIGGLSKIDAIAQTGISESSYKRAIKELEEKKYFVYTGQRVKDKQDASLPLYKFYAIPSVGSN